MRLDEVVVDGLARTLAEQRRIEDLIGSRAILGAARSHLALVLHLLRGARGPVTRRLAAIASEASQFNGWLSTAVNEHAAAGPFYDQALRLGMQAGDDDLAATALSMRGHLAWANGDYSEMAELSQAAADLAKARGTRAVAGQQRARALALLGERQSAFRAIGEAEETLTGPATHDDPDGLYFYGVAMLTMQRGLILRYTGDHIAAADAIVNGIQALPEAIRGSEWVAWYRVQAAAARASAGEVEASVADLRTALGVLSTTGGTKTLSDIAQVQASLKRRYPTHQAVTEFPDVAVPPTPSR
jgi:tetratricopeptide (TPR) repeat protein